MTAPAGVHGDRPVYLVSRDGQTIVVKRYLAGGAQAIHGQMRELWASPFGQGRRPPGLPCPMGVDPIRHEVEMQFLAGEAIGSRGDLGRSVQLLPEVARLLADLHASGVRVARRRDPAALVRSGRRKVDELGEPGGGHRSAVRILGRQVIDRLAEAMPPAGELVVSHGDFSPRNVLATPSGLALIDFDRLQMCEPQRDISYWGAWTWVALLLSGGRPSWQVADGLAAAYRLARPAAADPGPASWAFYRAAGLLRIAHGWSALRSAPKITAQVLGEAVLLLSAGAN